MPRPAAAEQLLVAHGFQVSKPRVYERNSVFDDPAGSLRASGKILRVREAGKHCNVTFKGKGEAGRHKVREEIETEVSDAKVFEEILVKLGYVRTFIYEKYRTEFSVSGESEKGTATLDETPIGTFLELEGEGEWIDRTAQTLGFQGNDYVLESYGALYLAWCAEHGVTPGNMVWKQSASS